MELSFCEKIAIKDTFLDRKITVSTGLRTIDS